VFSVLVRLQLVFRCYVLGRIELLLGFEAQLLMQMMNKEFWKFDGKPSEQGWHAVLVCYDEQEGTFPRAAYWDGGSWKQKAVVAFGEKRDTEESAESIAYENDPDA